MTPYALPLYLYARFVAQDSGGIPTDVSALGGYGAVSVIAILGLTLAWRTFVQTSAERRQLAEQVTGLQRELLRQADEHKDELLQTYQSVTAAMVASTAALKEASRLIEEQRLEHRLRGQ